MSSVPATAVWRDHTAQSPVTAPTPVTVAAVQASGQKRVSRASTDTPTATTATTVNSHGSGPMAARPVRTSHPAPWVDQGMSRAATTAATPAPATTDAGPGSIQRSTRHAMRVSSSASSGVACGDSAPGPGVRGALMRLPRRHCGVVAACSRCGSGTSALLLHHAGSGHGATDGVAPGAGRRARRAHRPAVAAVPDRPPRSAPLA
ncbi:hypothetical protein [Pseudonocardia sp. ICBG1142]|uniref:hypothetical protein n=1 Tax=Pseudonocardia sp. ICBG1142 TaxID=2846760 RepID=UPI001CF717BC|nr:hypothetical protein [Pseudonocardia sp. ICBG1142]